MYTSKDEEYGHLASGFQQEIDIFIFDIQIILHDPITIISDGTDKYMHTQYIRNIGFVCQLKRLTSIIRWPKNNAINVLKKFSSCTTQSKIKAHLFPWVTDVNCNVVAPNVGEILVTLHPRGHSLIIYIYCFSYV